MKIAYCDCFSGISGDMFLGALIDAGLPIPYLKDQLKKIDISEEYDIQVEETKKASLRACKFQVLTPQDHTDHIHPDHSDVDHHHDEIHHHEQTHSHDHSDSHQHDETDDNNTVQNHQKDEHHHHNRSFLDISTLIRNSVLSESIKSTALKIFERLAEAEARVHGTTVEEVHFHEVGALDSIIDIVGVAIGLDFLKIERLYASPLPWSGGRVNSQHGMLPLPAPATLEVLQMANAPLEPSNAHVELVTPTGAAILAALATFERPNLVLTGVGVGAGGRNLPWANIMRLIIGESEVAVVNQLVLMETNIDDMNPELYGYIMEKLFSAGALDVFMTPIYMKKNRPATLLGVIARKENEADLGSIILEETSSFGLRVQPIYRYEAQRKIEMVQTEYGQIPVKIKIIDGKRIQAVPEYSACVKAATENKQPLVMVYTAAVAAGKGLIS
jgi:pyridinium-3,5-bisthiocarboxylic acid mononucleotide nickel chelatase